MKALQLLALLGSVGIATACGGKISAVDDDTGATGSNPVSTGGATPVATGGTKATGGTTSSIDTGGTVSIGGTKSSTGTGGTPPVATGGSTTSNSAPNSGRTVTFSSGKAVGAMTGYGNVYVGTTDTVSTPTCGASQAAITSVAYCATTSNWSSATALCVTGSVPVADAPTYASWGLNLGANSTDPAGNGLGQSFTTIAITVTGTPAIGLRAVVHRKDDSLSIWYCAPLISGTAIPFTSFNTACWNSPPNGTALTAADVPNIDQIFVQVYAGPAAITVTNLCFTGITFS